MSTDPREFEHPIDGTGGAVPPFVEVIAAALTEHEAELDTSGDCYTGYCACNQKVPYVDHAAHQAHAVMAAISEAGFGNQHEAFAQGQKSGMRHADRLAAANEIGRPDLPGPLSPNPYPKGTP